MRRDEGVRGDACGVRVRGDVGVGWGVMCVWGDLRGGRGVATLPYFAWLPLSRLPSVQGLPAAGHGGVGENARHRHRRGVDGRWGMFSGVRLVSLDSGHDTHDMIIVNLPI